MSQEKFKPHPFAIRQGYLTKSPPLHKKKLAGWKKRWCILEPYGPNDEMCLSYYSDEEKSFFRLPKDRIFLAQCLKVEVDLRHSSHDNIFAIHIPERVYYFSASSRYEMTEWAETLCTHLNLTSDIPFPVESRKKSLSLPSRSNPRLKLLPKSSSDLECYIPSQQPNSFSHPISRDPPPICRDPPSNGHDPPSNGYDPPSVGHDSPPPLPPPRRGSNGKRNQPLPPPPPPPLHKHPSPSPSPPQSPSREQTFSQLLPPPPPHKHPSPSPSPPESPSREQKFSQLLPPPPPRRKESTASA